MSKIALSGNASGTGTFTVASPNSNTDRTLTLPDATGTFLTTATAGVPVNGPAFSAYMTNAAADQSATSGVFTKVKIDTEVFDTNSNFDSTTNYRFTPTVAGYYQLNSSVGMNAISASLYIAVFYKNGAIFGGAVQLQGVAGSGNQIFQCSQLMYLNGSTDYVELYGLIIGTSPVFVFGSNNTTFSASMVRAA
jgi:hypothetical protein